MVDDGGFGLILMRGRDKYSIMCLETSVFLNFLTKVRRCYLIQVTVVMIIKCDTPDSW